MRPNRLAAHVKTVEAKSNEWKEKYRAETGALRGDIRQLKYKLDDIAKIAHLMTEHPEARSVGNEILRIIGRPKIKDRKHGSQPGAST